MAAEGLYRPECPECKKHGAFISESRRDTALALFRDVETCDVDGGVWVHRNG